MAKHSVTRFADSQIYNKPHLILPDNLQQICSYLDKRNGSAVWKDELIDAAVKSNLAAKEYKESLSYGESECSDAKIYTVENGVAYLNIEGTLTYKPTMFSMLCGGMSYLELQDAVKQIAQDSGIKTVVMTVDSGGGEAYGAFETSRLIKKELKRSNKKIITYVDGMMASAAYALGCCADEIIMNPDASVGSIGVVIKLTDESEHQAMEGEKDIWIYAGDNKVPFDAEGHFKQEFLDRLQTSVDETYSEFIGLVGEMRNLPYSAIAATQANVFRSSQAIGIRLADKIMTRSDFEAYLADVNNSTKVSAPYGVDSGDNDYYEPYDGCGKKKHESAETEETPNQELSLASDIISESLTNKENSGDQSLENLEELLAMKAEFETTKLQMAEMAAQVEQLNALKAQAEAQAAQLASEKLMREKEEKLQALSSFSFIDESQKAALADFAMGNKEMGAALFSMFAKANEAIDLAASEVVAVKEAFAAEQGVDTALDVVVEAEKSAQDIIAERIAAKKAQAAK